MSKNGLTYLTLSFTECEYAKINFNNVKIYSLLRHVCLLSNNMLTSLTCINL